MTPADIPQLIDFVGKATVLTILAFILLGGHRRLWVWGYQLKECDDRLIKREAEWAERLKAREEELKQEIREWKDAHRKSEEMLDRSLTLQEQRLRDHERSRGAQ